MSTDPDSAASPESPSPPTPPPGSTREKMSIPQAKRRYKREAGSNVPEDEPPQAQTAHRFQRGGTASEPGETPDTEDGGLDTEIEDLSILLRQLMAQKRKTPPAAEPEGRSSKSVRLARNKTPTTPRDPTVPPSEGTAGPVTLPPRPVVYHVAGYETPWHPGWLLATAGVLVLGVVTFLLGRLSVGTPAAKDAATVSTAAIWSPADLDHLDRVLTTDAGGDLAAAYSLGQRLDDRLGVRPELERYLILLQARRGALNDAEANMVRRVDTAAPPLETAALQDRLGFVYSRRRDFKSASECFATVSEANPFDARAFYHWGEALRRMGRLEDAVGKFQEALLRLRPGAPETSSEWQCAAFRLRLAQIELGRDAEVKSALDVQLHQPAPSVYWLLTAAAYDLQHNDVPGAVSTLQRAQVVAPAEQFDALFNDYYLRTLATRSPETAAYAPELTAARKRQLDASLPYFIDP